MRGVCRLRYQSMSQSRKYVEMVRQIVESEAKNDEDHRGEIMIIFAGYTKKMEEFLKTNPGRTSRVPNKFVFESMKLHMLI